MLNDARNGKDALLTTPSGQEIKISADNILEIAGERIQARDKQSESQQPTPTAVSQPTEIKKEAEQGGRSMERGALER